MLAASYVLALMLKAEPVSPVRESFDATAAAIAEVASESPLSFGGKDAERTAAILVSLAWFESHFRASAGGDCPKLKADGTCETGSTPHSFGLFQIAESNFPYLGITREIATGEPRPQVESAIRLVRESFRVCKGRPVDERLAWYAAGGTSACTSETARGIRESKHRMAKAMWLYASVKPEG